MGMIYPSTERATPRKVENWYICRLLIAVAHIMNKLGNGEMLCQHGCRRESMSITFLEPKMGQATRRCGRLQSFLMAGRALYPRPAKVLGDAKLVEIATGQQ
jgi:hypothetical protein